MQPQQYQIEKTGPPFHVLATGLGRCFDVQGREIPCEGSGQDAEYHAGLPWPEPRFVRMENGVVEDRLTGLMWPENASPGGFPLTWEESLEAVAELNREEYLGHGDWRLPNRREMRSLISHGAKRPALPQGHPFSGVVQNWYWTSSTSAMAPGYAWYVHLAGGRMFYGKKDSAYMFWPVRGQSKVLPRTGQGRCFGSTGVAQDCEGSGHDAEVMAGAAWPEPRFAGQDGDVLDRLTGLVWRESANLGDGPVAWDAAIALVRELSQAGGKAWRLPNINELESLVDVSMADPALPGGHPFRQVGQAYWSSTSSFFEPDWSYCLYMHKGAVGVGYKAKPEFLVWAVR